MSISIRLYCRWAAAACLGGCASVGPVKTSLTDEDGAAVLTRAQLSRMYGSTAFDVLGALPTLRATVGMGARDPYVVCLDGTFLSSDLGVLRSIRATNLAEVRIASGPDAVAGPDGRMQIRITTVGALGRRC